MSYGNPFEKQISNRNFLSPTGFKFLLNRAPKVSFFGNSANLPAISMGTAIQPTYLKDIDRPGDKVQFGDFNFRFLVDENLENYLEIFNFKYRWVTKYELIYDVNIANKIINKIKAIISLISEKKSISSI